MKLPVLNGIAYSQEATLEHRLEDGYHLVLITVKETKEDKKKK